MPIRSNRSIRSNKGNKSDAKTADAREKALQEQDLSADPSPASPLMDVLETAAYLGLSRNTVYSEAKAGRLPTVRFGRRVLIVRSLLDEMVITRARAAWKERLLTDDKHQD